MCRIAAYIGEELTLRTLLLKPEHSLYVQSWQPKELSYAKLNADGFGFGWYLSDGTPVAYRSPSPIWSDSNLPALSDALSAPLWLAMVRSATANYGSSSLNVQPFCYRRLLFVHNGFIEEFNKGARHAIAAMLGHDVLENIRGLTDSEYLFGLLCEFVEKRGGDLETALADVAAWCQKNLSERVVMLNLAITDGAQLYALRFALNASPPTLYFTDRSPPNWPLGSQLLASEKLSSDDVWCEVPQRHLLTLKRGQPAALKCLD